MYRDPTFYPTIARRVGQFQAVGSSWLDITDISLAPGGRANPSPAETYFL